MFDLPATFWATGTPWGLVGVFVLLVFLGRLQPKSIVREQLDQANKTAEMWQEIAARESERADLAVKQSGDLLVGMDTIEHLVRSIAPAAKETR